MSELHALKRKFVACLKRVFSGCKKACPVFKKSESPKLSSGTEYNEYWHPILVPPEEKTKKTE